MSIPTWRKRIALWLFALLLPIATVSAVTLEDRSLYHPGMGDYPDNPAAALEGSPLTVEDVYFNTPDGLRLNGWFAAPTGNMPTIILAHGNGGNIADRLPILNYFVQHGYGFFMADYRGYGRSQGVAQERGLYTDFEAASDYLARVRHIPVSKQIAYGESLGSAIVVDVATRKPFKAVILSPALASIPGAARNLVNHNFYGLLSIVPVEPLVRQRFDALSKIDRISSPLLIVHGDADTLTPLWMAKTLHAKATTPHKKLVIIHGAGHNDVFTFAAARLLPTLEQLLAESTEQTKILKAEAAPQQQAFHTTGSPP